MTTFSARPATPSQTFPPLRDPGSAARIKRGLLRLVAFTANVAVVFLIAAVTALIVWPRAAQGAAVTLTAADAVDIVPGVSVTPAPGWTVGGQGPGWVALRNGYSTAEMEIKVMPADQTDAVAALQGNINQLSGVSTTGLTNVKNLSAPATKPVQSGNFQQEASIDYSADGTSMMGSIPVIGSFIELLNTSNHQSAFIVFAQNGDATTRADSEGGMMVDSML